MHDETDATYATSPLLKQDKPGLPIHRYLYILTASFLLSCLGLVITFFTESSWMRISDLLMLVAIFFFLSSILMLLADAARQRFNQHLPISKQKIVDLHLLSKGTSMEVIMRDVILNEQKISHRQAKAIADQIHRELDVMRFYEYKQSLLTPPQQG